MLTVPMPAILYEVSLDERLSLSVMYSADRLSRHKSASIPMRFEVTFFSPAAMDGRRYENLKIIEPLLRLILTIGRFASSGASHPVD